MRVFCVLEFISQFENFVLHKLDDLRLLFEFHFHEGVLVCRCYLGEHFGCVWLILLAVQAKSSLQVVRVRSGVLQFVADVVCLADESNILL